VHVALNALQLVPGETGGLEIYARNLVPALERADGRLRLTVFAAHEAVRELEREGWQADLVALDVDPRSRVRGVIAEQLTLPRLVRRSKPDLLHNLLNTAPVLPFVPQVTTIHDLIYRIVPETHAGLRAWGLRLIVPLGARRSTRIVAVSQATASDVTRMLGVPADRVDVAPNGPGSPPGPATDEAEIRRELGLGDEPIVLAVSARRPHKNLGRLVEAMQGIDAVLVMPGYRTAFEDELRSRTEELGVAVRIRGWLEDADLEGLYRAASCFVLPSLAEGFGLPVLEAMARGTPVACSDIPPLREVAGDAAEYFDPRESKEIRRAIDSLLGDADLRARRADAGRKRAAAFSWARAAEATIASYERALKDTRPG
jgi:glycosyltransferase involved in cell wall biosynthesis